MAAEGLTNLELRELEEAGISIINAADFLAKPLPPPDWIIPDMICKNMKCDIIGKSKTMKTFFSLQLAGCIAEGRDFLAIPIPRPRKVAYINLELMEVFMQERLTAQQLGLNLTPAGLANLTLLNVRGKGRVLREKANLLLKSLKNIGCDLVIVDPQYKLLQADEDENSGAGMQGILEFRDHLATEFAVILVAHDTKGEVGHKAITDRGSGSGFLGRDFDFRFVLTEHSDGIPSHIVISNANRNRKPVPDFTAVFDEDAKAFFTDETITPIMATALSHRCVASKNDKIATNAANEEMYTRDALKVAEDAGDKFLGLATFRSEIDKTESGSLAINTKTKLLNALFEKNILVKQPELTRKENGEIGNKKHGKTFVSTPDRIKDYRAQFELLDL